MKALNQSSRYRKFINERNRTLDRMHMYTRYKLDVVLEKTKEKILDLISRSLMQNVPHDQLHRAIQSIITPAIYDSASIVKHESIIMYTLSGTAAATALALATDKKIKLQLTSHDVKQRIDKDTIMGGKIENRIYRVYKKLERKIIDAYELGHVLEEPTQDIFNRVKNVFPKFSERKIPNELQRIKEANPVGARILTDDSEPLTIEDLTADQISDDLWGSVVDYYKQTESIPPRVGEVFYDPDKGYMVTDWEIQQEANQNYIEKVRNGENDLAKENGVTDFMWIAVLDDRTDECCSIRDGLSTAEIEDKLKSGDIDADLCDAVTAPAHVKCRCDMAPMTDDLPEQPEVDWKGFDEWLNT